MAFLSRILLLVTFVGKHLFSLSGGVGLALASSSTSDHSSLLPRKKEDTRIAQIKEKLTLVLSDKSSGSDGFQNESSLWKQLGKLNLDAGEYAEAARIFRIGSTRCPGDSGLKHHSQVYEAFHGKSTSEATTPNSNSPLLTSDKSNLEDFMAFDVPSNVIPLNVRKDGTKLVHASTKPLLTKETCQYLINAATQKTRQVGWTKDRHVHAPTCDIPVHELDDQAIRTVRNMLRNDLFPLVSSLFPKTIPDCGVLRCQDCFIVRYDGSASEASVDPTGFSSLRPHEDESVISLTIALNDMDEYEDGGLFIASTGDLLNGNAGTFMCFAGGLVHGGYPVKRGTRWIMTVFLYVDTNASGKGPGYTFLELASKTDN